MRNLILLFANRPFVRFWSAGLLFQLATWALHVAMLVYVFELTGSPFATGLIPVFASLPGILLGPIAGVLVDRWDRRRVMVVSTLLIVALLLAVLPFAGDVRPGLLFAIIAVEAAVMAFFAPAENAILPRLVGDRDVDPDHGGPLRTANALNAFNDNLGRILGPAVGAFVLIQFGFGAVLVCCVLLHLGAVALLVGVRVPPSMSRVAPDPAIPVALGRGLAGVVRRAGREWGDGLRAVRANQVLLLTVAGFGLFLLADVPLSAVLPAFSSESLGAGSAGLGIMLPVRGVTGVLGGLLVAALSHRVSETRLLAGGLLLHGAGVAVMGLSGSFAVALLMAVPIGPAAAAIQTGLFTLLQCHSPDAVRGRVFGLVGTVNGIVILATSLAAGSLGEAVGAQAVVVLSGCLYVVPLALVVVWLRPRLAQVVT